jgi:hypothetical protein
MQLVKTKVLIPAKLECGMVKNERLHKKFIKIRVLKFTDINNNK